MHDVAGQTRKSSQTADTLGKKFQGLYPCFHGQAVHWCRLIIPEIDTAVTKTGSRIHRTVYDIV